MEVAVLRAQVQDLEMSLEGGPACTKREIVQKIIASPSFTKSIKLSHFLSYICQQTISGDVAQINEQTIGERVFHRPPGYDPSQDNIVRANATRLRQKLDLQPTKNGNWSLPWESDSTELALSNVIGYRLSSLN